MRSTAAQFDEWDLSAPITVRTRTRTPKSYVAPLPVSEVREIHNAADLPADGEQPPCTYYRQCRSKYCIKCESRKTHRAAKKIAERMHGNRCAFITLTCRHTTDNVGEQRDSLFADFRNLRQTKDWKALVAGGRASMHVTTKTGEACHLHMAVEMVGGGSIDELAEAIKSSWRGISDVQPVRSSIRDCNAVSHYMTRGMLRQFDGRDTSELDAARDLLARRSKTIVFGTWRKSARKLDNGSAQNGNIHDVLVDEHAALEAFAPFYSIIYHTNVYSQPLHLVGGSLPSYEWIDEIDVCSIYKLSVSLTNSTPQPNCRAPDSQNRREYDPTDATFEPSLD